MTDSKEGSQFFVREVDLLEKTIKIHQATIGDVGCVVWDAALVLLHFLKTPCFTKRWVLKERRAIELGAGTGVVGIGAALLGADVTLTDLPELLHLLQKNVEENKDLVNGSLSSQTLVWGETCSWVPPYPHYIFIADCIYYEKSLQPLVQTMIELSNAETTILLSYERRTSDAKIALESQFMNMVDEHFTRVEVPMDKHDEIYRSEDIHILVLKLKKVT